MKRIITIAALLALSAGLLGGCAASEEAVSVESVAMITGIGPAGITDSYAGKVVSGQTAELKRDADKTVLDVLVEEGDMVRKGDVLFTYDTEAMQLSLDKLYLDLESYENTIAAANNEISELERQRANASSSQQLNYTLQIDARNADIREAEYNIALKQKEIETMEASMDDTEITSPIAGRVMSVGSLDDAGAGMNTGMGAPTGSSDAFITVMDVSAYRVEGYVNELNRGTIAEGMPVLLRSRTDSSLVWRGVIDSIDWENPVTGQNNQSYYYDAAAGDEMTNSSKYPFYIALDDQEGLLLGLHVYIEPDLGQEDGAGLMLPAYYLAGTGADAWVWAASAAGKLEKRAVALGAYDDALDCWEITAGLAYTDYIAFPQDGLSEGAPVVYYDETSFAGADGVYEEGFDEGLYEEEFDGVVYEEGVGG